MNVLLDLIARERRRRIENGDAPYDPASFSDEDRVKALQSFFWKVGYRRFTTEDDEKAWYAQLAPDDKMRISALQKLAERVNQHRTPERVAA